MTWRKYSFDHSACAVLGPDMRIGLEPNAAMPAASPVQPLKTTRAPEPVPITLAFTDAVAKDPAWYQPAVVAAPYGVWIVREYWVPHCAVATFGRSITIPFDVTPVPAASPDQRSKSSCVPGLTATCCEATPAWALVPWSYQPAPETEPYALDTSR